MSYIENVRVFVRTVEVGNLSAAGRDLRVSPAVASNRIKELEKHLGVRLFDRTTRQLATTEQGRIFYEGAKRILETIEESEAAVADLSGNPKGSILVSAPLGFGRVVLAPLVPLFQKQFPDISVRLRLSDRKVDIIKEGVNLAFHMGELKDSNLKMVMIGKIERKLVASPEYVKAHGLPKNLMDLKRNHNCLLLRFPGSREYYWTFEEENGELNRLEVSGKYDSDHGDVLTSWALAGHGIANKAIFEVASHLKSGELQTVEMRENLIGATLCCLYPHRRFQDPKLRAFIDYMVPRCKEAINERLRLLD